MKRPSALAGAILLLVTPPALARPAFSCGGFAMTGGAQMMCSHIDPSAPAQICTFSWTLLSTSNTPSVVAGSFLLPPGITNSNVYQGSGYTAELSNPIVLCQGQKTGR